MLEGDVRPLPPREPQRHPRLPTRDPPLPPRIRTQDCRPLPPAAPMKNGPCSRYCRPAKCPEDATLKRPLSKSYTNLLAPMFLPEAGDLLAQSYTDLSSCMPEEMRLALSHRELPSPDFELQDSITRLQISDTRPQEAGWQRKEDPEDSESSGRGTFRPPSSDSDAVAHLGDPRWPGPPAAPLEAVVPAASAVAASSSTSPPPPTSPSKKQPFVLQTRLPVVTGYLDPPDTELSSAAAVASRKDLRGLRRKLDRLESMYSEVLQALGASSRRKRRLERLEAQVGGLAKHLGRLAGQGPSLGRELGALQRDVGRLRRQLAARGPCPGSQVDLLDMARVSKLTKIFGEEPPLLRNFLKKLGYEQYAPKLEAEQIGVRELPYLDEDRLKKLGIPMGPRLRILHEAQLAVSPGLKIYFV